MLKQLRTISFPREADSTNDQPCLSRRRTSSLWKRWKCPWLVTRIWPLRSYWPDHPQRKSRGSLQRRWTNERTNLEVVKTILKALDKPESLIKFVTDRPGHDMRYAIDPTKLETELGWKPKYNFDTGIAQTIEWYLNNKEWWQNILSGEYANYFDKMYGNRL